MKVDPVLFYGMVLLKQGLHFLLVLKHLQHFSLQLDGKLLQHLVVDHQRDLVSQTLAGNLWFNDRTVEKSHINFVNSALKKKKSEMAFP